MVNSMIFRTALKAEGKNSENMSLRMYTFSTMHNIRMQYELYKELHDSEYELYKEQRELYYKAVC